MRPAGEHHLATITPIDPSEARQVMNLFCLTKNSLCFVAFQTSWIWLGVIGAVMFQSPDPFSTTIGIGFLLLAFVWLIAQVTMAFVYPEWPINLLLSARLRNSIIARFDRPPWVSNSELRVVELVPRERWNKMALETATDLLLIHVDATGVQMEGDCDRYELPCGSILGAELHSIRPSGWFTDTHMVIITARTEQGAVEVPISYRDHRFGGLRNSRRRHEALELTEQINSIATGASHEPLTSSPHITERARMDFLNPYAPPASL